MKSENKLEKYISRRIVMITYLFTSDMFYCIDLSQSVQLQK